MAQLPRKTEIKHRILYDPEDPEENTLESFESEEKDDGVKQFREEEAIGRLVEEEIQLRKHGVIHREKDSVEQRTMATLWSEDEKTIRIIQEALKRSDETTQKMVTILKSFNSRLTTTIDSINLIRDQVTAKANELSGIRKSITEISDIMKEYDALDDHGKTIERGIPKPSLKLYQDNDRSSRVKEFLDADEAIIRANNFFTQSDTRDLMDAKEKATKLTEKHNYACNVLVNYFTAVLQLFSAPKLLKDINEPLSAIFIPRTACIDLGLIASRLDLEDSSYTSIFVRERKKFLKETFFQNFGIQMRAEEKYEKSDSSHQLLDTQPDQGELPEKEIDGTSSEKKKEKSKRSGNAFEVTCEQLLAPPSDTRGYVRASHIFHKIIDCVLLLLSSEEKICRAIIPQERVKTFAKVINDTLAQFETAGHVLLRIQERQPDRIYGIVVLLDIWEQLRSNYGSSSENYLEVFQRILEPIQGTARKKSTGREMINFWTDLEFTIGKIFNSVVDEVENDPIRALPADGTVHALTSNTINFLLRLFDYEQTVISLLPRSPFATPSISTITTISPIIINSSMTISSPIQQPQNSSSQQSQSLKPFAVYIRTVITKLKQNLELKARKDKSSDALSNIFKLNNFYFIWKKIGNTTLINEVGDTLNEYESWWKAEEKIYIDSWRGVKEYLEDDWKPSRRVDLLAVGKSKPNRLIKDRFNGFNQEIKSLFETQQHFFIADEELRTKMRKSIREQVLPGYKMIVEKYKDVNFSKNVDEFIKYTPKTLEDMIMNEFFEGRLKSKRKGLVQLLS